MTKEEIIQFFRKAFRKAKRTMLYGATEYTTPVYCPHCNEKYPNLASLNCHLITNHGKNTFYL